MQKVESPSPPIAALEHKAGLKIHALRNIIKGYSKKPTVETLQKVADVLGCTMAELAGKANKGLPRSYSTVAWKPELFKACVDAVIASLNNSQTLKLKDVSPLIYDVYCYSIDNQSNKLDIENVDEKFARWVVEQKLGPSFIAH
jgi:transcriptional regulator with XRE-family HTH domain